MAIVRRTRAEIAASPAFSPEQRARIEAMTDEEIERDALENEDSPPATDVQLDRGAFGREVRLARLALGLTQEAFATALGLPVATLRNWEQGRVSPDPAARALIRIVRKDPAYALKMLAA